MALWVFAIFWHFTTGEWRQYLPTTNRLGAVARYYLIGTFTGASHPFRKTSRAKHNPLQRLAYLGFKLLITPVIWISGLAYLFYNQWHVVGASWPVPGPGGNGPHRRRLRHAHLHHCPCVHGDHGPHDLQPHPAHDLYWLLRGVRKYREAIRPRQPRISPPLTAVSAISQ
ncbi:MAG: hypothetical protein U5L11_02905 [Arhodomonas sp.]|nr:hypothetical protein [Arhodomonas sp.]